HRMFASAFGMISSFLALLALGHTVGCGADRTSPDSQKAPAGTEVARAADRSGPASGLQPGWFTDRAKETGIDFVHFNGMSGKFYYPEVMAPGVALFDYDN